MPDGDQRHVLEHHGHTLSRDMKKRRRRCGSVGAIINVLLAQEQAKLFLEQASHNSENEGRRYADGGDVELGRPV